MTEDSGGMTGTETSTASTNRTCGSGTAVTGCTIGMPGGWGGGGSSGGCGTSTPRRCTHTRTPTSPNGGATGSAAVGPHAVLVLLRTCEGLLPLCHELSGRMDAGGPAAHDAPVGRLSAVWVTARLRAAGHPPAGLLPHEAAVRECGATDGVGTRFGKQRPLPTGLRTQRRQRLILSSWTRAC